MRGINKKFFSFSPIPQQHTWKKNFTYESEVDGIANVEDSVTDATDVVAAAADDVVVVVDGDGDDGVDPSSLTLDGRDVVVADGANQLDDHCFDKEK